MSLVGTSGSLVTWKSDSAIEGTEAAIADFKATISGSKATLVESGSSEGY